MPTSGVPCSSTYTVLDVEVSAIHNQKSDHLITVQSYGIMQWGISFLERQSKQVSGGGQAGSSLKRPSRLAGVITNPVRYSLCLWH